MVDTEGAGFDNLHSVTHELWAVRIKYLSRDDRDYQKVSKVLSRLVVVLIEVKRRFKKPHYSYY